MFTERARNRAFAVILVSQQRHVGTNAAGRLQLHPIPLFHGQYTVTLSACVPSYNHLSAAGAH